jgi:hypothetical protein
VLFQKIELWILTFEVRVREFSMTHRLIVVNICDKSFQNPLNDKKLWTGHKIYPIKGHDKLWPSSLTLALDKVVCVVCAGHVVSLLWTILPSNFKTLLRIIKLWSGRDIYRIWWHIIILLWTYTFVFNHANSVSKTKENNSDNYYRYQAISSHYDCNGKHGALYKSSPPKPSGLQLKYLSKNYQVWSNKSPW